MKHFKLCQDVTSPCLVLLCYPNTLRPFAVELADLWSYNRYLSNARYLVASYPFDPISLN